MSISIPPPFVYLLDYFLPKLMNQNFFSNVDTIFKIELLSKIFILSPYKLLLLGCCNTLKFTLDKITCKKYIEIERIFLNYV